MKGVSTRTAIVACPACFAVYSADHSVCSFDGQWLEHFAQDPLIGHQLGQYCVEALLGAGAMGRVYRARHVRMSRLFAVKVLAGDLAADREMRARFAREAETASRVDHPNLVGVVDTGETAAGLPYLAMDLVEGEALDEVLAREGALPPTRVIALLRGMLRGLAHAHGRGLIHRDLKPANILLAGPPGDPVPRIVDFGIALVRESIGDRITKGRLVFGTPEYMAPEQARGEDDVDHRANLFALGVVVYEMLAGVRPFSGRAVDVLRQQLTVAPPPLALRTPGIRVPPALEAIAMRLMAKRASERFASADEVLEVLEAVVAPHAPGGSWRLPSTLAALPRPARTAPRAVTARTAARVSAAEGASDVYDAYQVTQLTLAGATPAPARAYLIGVGGVLAVAAAAGLLWYAGIDPGASATARAATPAAPDPAARIVREPPRPAAERGAAAMPGAVTAPRRDEAAPGRAEAGRRITAAPADPARGVITVDPSRATADGTGATAVELAGASRARTAGGAPPPGSAPTLASARRRAPAAAAAPTRVTAGAPARDAVGKAAFAPPRRRTAAASAAKRAHASPGDERAIAATAPRATRPAGSHQAVRVSPRPAPAPRPAALLTPDELVARYQRLGGRLDALSHAAPAAATLLRDRYFAIPLADALRRPQQRAEVAAALTRLERLVTEASANPHVAATD